MIFKREENPLFANKSRWSPTIVNSFGMALPKASLRSPAFEADALLLKLPGPGTELYFLIFI